MALSSSSSPLYNDVTQVLFAYTNSTGQEIARSVHESRLKDQIKIMAVENEIKIF